MARAIKKTKTKSWYSIRAPKVFNEDNTVESTVCLDPASLINRTVTVKLSQIIGDMRKSDQKLKLKIVDVKGLDAYTEIRKYELTRMSLMRIVRRRSSKIESVDDVVSKDGKNVRAKTVIVTKGKATENQRRAIKNKFSKLMVKAMKENTFDSLVLAIISKKIQRDIIKEIRILFPIIAVEVRAAEIRTKKKTTGEHKSLKIQDEEEEKVETKEEPKEEKVEENKKSKSVKKKDVEVEELE